MDKAQNLNGYKNKKIGNVRRKKYSLRVRLNVATKEHRQPLLHTLSLVAQVRIAAIGTMLTMMSKVTKVTTVNFVIKVFVSASGSPRKVPVIFVQF